MSSHIGRTSACCTTKGRPARTGGPGLGTRKRIRARYFRRGRNTEPSADVSPRVPPSDISRDPAHKPLPRSGSRSLLNAGSLWGFHAPQRRRTRHAAWILSPRLKAGARGLSLSDHWPRFGVSAIFGARRAESPTDDEFQEKNSDAARGSHLRKFRCG